MPTIHTSKDGEAWVFCEGQGGVCAAGGGHEAEYPSLSNPAAVKAMQETNDSMPVHPHNSQFHHPQTVPRETLTSLKQTVCFRQGELFVMHFF
jgi:hypothetical protein